MPNNKDWWEESEAGQVSDFYEMQVGDNKVRILTKFEKVNQLSSDAFGKGEYLGMVEDNYVPKGTEVVSAQGWAWGIDRATSEMKIFTLGRGILQKLTLLKNSEEYGFSDFPMPYDITIHNTGNGPTRYSVTPARQNTEVSETEMAQLNKQKTIKDIVEAIKNKRSKSNVANGNNTVYEDLSKDAPNQADIPF